MIDKINGSSHWRLNIAYVFEFQSPIHQLSCIGSNQSQRLSCKVSQHKWRMNELSVDFTPLKIAFNRRQDITANDQDIYDKLVKTGCGVGWTAYPINTKGEK